MRPSLIRSLKPFAIVFALFVLASPLFAQPGLTQPPSGDNQKAKVVQWIGLVKVSIDYSSPDVHAPDGADRRGKIWGELVPYGMANLGFGTCGDQCPWRGGANENSVFEVSHDVKVQGQSLPAGRYGLHFVPGKEEWTVIFSKDSSAWGSFFYDAKNDALRVTAEPEKSEFREWLSYEFIDRKGDRATVALAWEELRVPFTIAVENINDLYVEQMRRELRGATGFSWQNWMAAAQFCLQNKLNLVEAEQWASQAVAAPFVGNENFNTLTTLARLQEANGKATEGKATFDKALRHPTARPVDIHQYGRSLIAAGKAQEAMAVFQLNAQRFPNQWPVHVGLARGYSAVGNLKEALKHAKLALAQAPDELNKKSLERAVATLIEGKPWS